MPADAEPLSIHRRAGVRKPPEKERARSWARPELRNAMRISTGPSAYNALHQSQQREIGACRAASSLACGWSGSVAMLPGERRRGQHESGGGDRGLLGRNCLHCWS
jgi:hypothetical protein